MICFTPGQVIGVRVGFITHVGIVTDRTVNGEPMVISNSLRRGEVAEEPLSMFKGAFELVPVEKPAAMPAWIVLSRAREKLGTQWKLTSWNCEHFVTWAFGHEPQSKQLQAGVVTGVIALFSILNRA